MFWKYLLLCFRYTTFKELVTKIEANEGSLEQFTRGYEQFGIHRKEDNSLCMTEWAPGAAGVYLRGDFSQWSFCVFFVYKTFIQLVKRKKVISFAFFLCLLLLWSLVLIPSSFCISFHLCKPFMHCLLSHFALGQDESENSILNPTYRLRR